jgi:ABC-type transport system involved in cytochrome c biogenesis permease subunit
VNLAVEKALLVTSVAGFALALLVLLALRRQRADTWWPVSAVVSSVVACLSVAIAIRWLREAQGPFLTLYDVLLSNLFSLSLVFVIAAGLVPALRASASLVLAFLAFLGVWALAVDPNAVPLPATFDNPWLWLHVLSGKLFLGLCMLAAATAGLLLIGKRVGLEPPIPVLDDRDRAVWLTLSLAFVCHSFMLIAGAIWAHSAWGRYWAWDSLETWTFVTWLSIALLLHARATFRRMPPAVGWSAVVGIFALAILTFLGVPFVSIAPHKGVM